MNLNEIKIGDQIWTSNLDFDDGGEGIYKSNNETYYTYDAALRVSKKIEGWHLPTKEEFKKLIDFCGGSDIAGKKLKSTSGWYDSGNGTDDYGFNALPVGGRNYNNGVFYYLGNNSYFWSATEYDALYAYILNLYYDYEGAGLSDYYKIYAFSVRLIKD